MQTTFLMALATALSGTQHRLNVAIESAPNDGVKVLVTADLGPTPEKATEAEAQLRAAMCRPLIVSGSAADVDAALVHRLTKHVRGLDEGQSLLDEIRQIGAEVRNKAPEASSVAPSAPADDDSDDDLNAEQEPVTGAPAESEPADAEDGANPLFKF